MLAPLGVVLLLLVGSSAPRLDPSVTVWVIAWQGQIHACEPIDSWCATNRGVAQCEKYLRKQEPEGGVEGEPEDNR